MIRVIAVQGKNIKNVIRDAKKKSLSILKNWTSNLDVHLNIKFVCIHWHHQQIAGHTIIKAHTIQRAGAISKLIDTTNHVLTFYPPERDTNKMLKVHRRGWKEASTFNGFCNTHDTSLFTDLETRPFVGDEKQCFLIGYRAACHEIYQKIAVNTIGNPLMQKNLDKGLPKDNQIAIQKRLIKYAEETDMGF